jgi:hypothetical protein
MMIKQIHVDVPNGRLSVQRGPLVGAITPTTSTNGNANTLAADLRKLATILEEEARAR